jgi:predicted aminopeptidase
MSPEERDSLRRQQRILQEQREKSVNEAYQRSGLHLNEEQRQQFRKRYVQERKKLEEQLLKETQEKRQAGNTAIIDALRKEFSSSQPQPPGTPSASGR